jgi:hypothetical protein
MRAHRPLRRPLRSLELSALTAAILARLSPRIVMGTQTRLEYLTEKVGSRDLAFKAARCLARLRCPQCRAMPRLEHDRPCP